MATVGVKGLIKKTHNNVTVSVACCHVPYHVASKGVTFVSVDRLLQADDVQRTCHVSEIASCRLDVVSRSRVPAVRSDK